MSTTAKNQRNFVPDDLSIPTSGQRDMDDEIEAVLNREGHEYDDAKYLLEQVEKLAIKNTSAYVSFCLGTINDENETLKKIFYFTQLFYKKLEHQNLLKNLEFTDDVKNEESSSLVWYISFDTNIIELRKYLKNYLDTNNGKLIKICIDTKIGIYAEDNKKKIYKITEKGKGGKRFKLICILEKEGSLCAKLLVNKVGYTRSNKISDEFKGINGQFTKHTGILHNIILRSAEQNYFLNKDKFNFEFVRNL